MTTRKALLDGARRCLATHGYARTTARHVARAAGVSLGTIPYHFGSMDALLSEAIADNLREWVAAFASVLADDPAGEPRGLLRRAVGEFFRLLQADRAMLVLFFEAVALADRLPDLRQELAQQYEELRDAVQQMLQGVLGPELAEQGLDVRVLASLLLAVSDGLIVQFLIDPTAAPSAEQLDAAFAVLGVR